MAGGVVNVLLVRWADGFVEVVAGTISPRRREAFLSLGRSPSAARATAEAQKHLVTAPREKVTVATEPAGSADQPYVGYGVADTIGVPDMAGANQSRRVRSLSVTEDDEGNPSFVPGLAP